ncbi:OmpH family outer membrane protein [Verrucomicrobiota bacterium]
MRITIKSIAVFGLMMLFAGRVYCGETKIAVVDMSKIVNVFPSTETAKAALESQKTEYEAEHKNMLAELERLKEEFEQIREDAGNKALSEDARSKNAEVAKNKFTKLRELEYKIMENTRLRRKQMVDQEKRLLEKIVSQIRDVVGEYAEKKNYVLVLDSSIIVYKQEAIDITKDILKIVDKEKK